MRVPLLMSLVLMLSSCVSAPPDGRCYSCEGLMQAGQMMQQQPRRYESRPIQCNTMGYGNGHSTTTCY